MNRKALLLLAAASILPHMRGTGTEAERRAAAVQEATLLLDEVVKQENARPVTLCRNNDGTREIGPAASRLTRKVNPNFPLVPSPVL